MSIRALLRHRYQREFTEPANIGEQIRVKEVMTIAGAGDQQAEPQENTINTVNQAFFDKINEVLEKHFSEESMDVPLLASKMAMNDRQLRRKMKSLLDLNPAESIRSFRLKKAAELLIQGVSPSVVAYQVGFTSDSYFSQCFKAQFGCLPSHYHSVPSAEAGVRAR